VRALSATIVEEEHAGRPEQPGAGDPLSHTERLVTSEAGAEAAMPIVDSISI
jgi:hypothetical protein